MLTLTPHRSTVHSLAFFEGGRSLASVAGNERRVCVTDLASLAVSYLPAVPFPPPPRGTKQCSMQKTCALPVETVAVSPDGTQLATLERSGNVSLHDFRTSTVLANTLSIALGAYPLRPMDARGVLRPRLLWTTPEQLLIVNGRAPSFQDRDRPGDPEQHIFRPSHGQWNVLPVSPIDGKRCTSWTGTSFRLVIDCDLLPKGRLAVLGQEEFRTNSVGHGDRVIEVLDETGALLSASEPLPSGGWRWHRWLRCIGPDDRLAVATYSGLAFTSPDGIDWETRFYTEDDVILAMEAVPEAGLLLLGMRSGCVLQFDTLSDADPLAYQWEVGPIHRLAVSPDGLLFAAGGESGIVVWDRE